jgi:hypothetical protein
VPGIRTWAEIFVAVAVAAAVLSVLSRAVLARKLAVAVLHNRGRSPALGRAWKGACLLASLLPTAVVVLILAILVQATIAAGDLPAGGVGLILAVAVGVVGNHVDRQFATGWTFYWEKIHDSLRAAMPVVQRIGPGIPSCQRTRFNVTHRLLHHPDGQRPILASILAADPCTAARPCAGHGGPTHAPPAPREDAVSPPASGTPEKEPAD